MALHRHRVEDLGTTVAGVSADCLSRSLTLKPAELHPRASGLSLEEVVDLRPTRRRVSGRELRNCEVCGGRLHIADDRVCGACEYGLELGDA